MADPSSKTGVGHCASCSQTSDEFLYCKKNIFIDKLADSSSCDNVKGVHIQWALRPTPVQGI